MTITDLIIRRTLTVDHINPSLTAAVLTGARLPLRELAELEGRDVVVLTLAELRALVSP